MNAQARLVALFVLLFPLLVGCGHDETSSSAALGSGDLRWASFPVDVQADSFLMLDSNAKQDLFDAMDFWEARAGRQLFNLVGAWDNGRAPYVGDPANPDVLLGNVIYLQGPWPFDASIAGKTHVNSNGNAIQHAVVLLNTEKSFCTGDCVSQDQYQISRRKLIAHELGHFLGFAHSPNNDDLMYPEILPGGSLDHVQINDVLLNQLTD